MNKRKTWIVLLLWATAGTARADTVLEFGTDSCIECVKMRPVVELLRREGKRIEYVDAEKDSRAARYQVSRFPTFIHLDENGRETRRIIGSTSEGILRGLFRRTVRVANSLTEPQWWGFNPTGAVSGKGIYQDVVSRLDANGRRTMGSPDQIEYVHEGTHHLNNMIRNLRGPNGTHNAVYVGGGRCLILAEPRLTMKTAVQYAPADARAALDAPAFEHWSNRPLYLIDEWTCYCNGLQAIREGASDASNHLNTPADAIKYGQLADSLIEAIRRHDPNYRDLAQLTAFVAWQKQRVAQLGGTTVTVRKPAPNFTVSAPTQELADEVAATAERLRGELAQLWLGKEIPDWPSPCHITVQVRGGSGGDTTFTFGDGRMVRAQMRVQGSRQRILDSVLPHEISHTILATHFGNPVPRWADEGGCSTMEHLDEQARYEREVVEALKTKRGIAFRDMFAAQEYPPDFRAFYAQGHSVSQWLIEKHGTQHFVHSLEAGLRDGQWAAAFGYDSEKRMQDDWLEWVKAGRPRVHTVAYQGCQRCLALPRIGLPRVIGIVQGMTQAVTGRYPANVTVQVRPQPTFVPPPGSGLTPPVQPSPIVVEQNPRPPLDVPTPQQPVSTLEQELQEIRDQLANVSQCNCDHTPTAEALAAIQVAISQFDQRITNIENTPLPTVHPFNVRLSRESKGTYTPYVKVNPADREQFVTINLDLIDLAQ